MASASRLALACDTRPDSTASRTEGAAWIACAVLTRLWASPLCIPAASASTCVPPSPWRSAPAMARAAPTWNAAPAAMNALETSSASRTSEHDTEPALIQASISLAAASARRAASISMSTVFHRGVIFVKHLHASQVSQHASCHPVGGFD